MKIANLVSGILVSAAAFVGTMTFSPTAHATATYSDSCTPIGGGYSNCQTTRCDSESGACVVVATWVQYIPEASIDE